MSPLFSGCEAHKNPNGQLLMFLEADTLQSNLQISSIVVGPAPLRQALLCAVWLFSLT